MIPRALAVLIVLSACAATEESAVQTLNAPQVACGPAPGVARTLLNLYGEKPVEFGVTEMGSLFQIYVSPAGSWSAVMTGPNGLACLMAVGNSWDRVRLKPAGKGI